MGMTMVGIVVLITSVERNARQTMKSCAIHRQVVVVVVIIAVLTIARITEALDPVRQTIVSTSSQEALMTTMGHSM
jgi:hypothetical protein